MPESHRLRDSRPSLVAVDALAGILGFTAIVCVIGGITMLVLGVI